jgi:hypothetical protein
MYVVYLVSDYLWASLFVLSGGCTNQGAGILDLGTTGGSKCRLRHGVGCTIGFCVDLHAPAQGIDGVTVLYVLCMWNTLLLAICIF